MDDRTWAEIVFDRDGLRPLRGLAFTDADVERLAGYELHLHCVLADARYALLQVMRDPGRAKDALQRIVANAEAGLTAAAEVE